MHAGEALWMLHTIVSDLERRSSANPGALALAAQGHQACDVLATFLKIPLPVGDQVVANQAYVEQIKSAAAARYAATQSNLPITDANGKFALELCDEILAALDSIEALGIEAATNYAAGVRETTSSMRESIVARRSATDKMVNALHNMKAGAQRWLDNHGQKAPWE